MPRQDLDGCSPPAAGRSAPSPPGAAPHTWRVGCVSYLNAKPLIHGMEEAADAARARARYDVPSRLLDDLLSGAVDVALCPVIDYFRSPRPLVVVPSGVEVGTPPASP